MSYPRELRYVRTREWVKMGDDTAIVGLSDYARNELGDLVFVSLPEMGDQVDAGETSGDVEFVKAVSDLNSPVIGIVIEVNEELLDAPELINSDSYGAWLIKMEPVEAKSDLLDADAYEALVNEKS